MTRLEKWQALANMHLLAHIRAQAAKGIYYAHFADRTMPVHRGEKWRPTRETAELTEPLVRFKNAWVRDMLDYEQEHGTVPESEARRQWADCIARAEAEVENVRRHHAAGKAA